MTRDVRFRAWLHEERCMMYGALSDYSLSHLFDSIGHTLHPVMQYTGLNDTLGHPIYEGDIIEWWPNGSNTFTRTAVEWHVDSWVTGGVLLRYAVIDRARIVGNLYETPHLIAREP